MSTQAQTAEEHRHKPRVAQRTLRRRKRSAEDEWVRQPLSKLRKLLLTAGTVAGAVGSIVGVVTNVGHSVKPIHAHKKQATGEVAQLAIRGIRPLTYGEWTKGHTRTLAERRTPGKLLSYDVTTHGFAPGLYLPVRYVLHDVTTSKSKLFKGLPLRTDGVDRCGCSAWIPVPRTDDRYFIEVQVFGPGAIGEGKQPERNQLSGYFNGTNAS